VQQTTTRHDWQPPGRDASTTRLQRDREDTQFVPYENLDTRPNVIDAPDVMARF